MIKNSTIIIPSQEKKHEICDFLFQTARTLTENNTVIILQLKESYSIKEILVNIFKKGQAFKLIERKQGSYYFKPLFIIPFRRFNFIYDLNIKINCLFLQLIINSFGEYKKKILWMFFPHEEKITNYFNNDWTIIYDIVDFYTLPTKEENMQLEEKKKRLLKNSHLITAISNSLKKKYQKLTNKKIHQVPQGFNLIKINENLLKKIEKKNNLKKPLIGYIGHINNRFNLSLLLKLIKNNPQWNFVFVGPKHHDNNISYKDQSKKIEEIFILKNVFWVKQQPKKNIYQFIYLFDVCIIPYDIKYNFNKYSYPMKLFEYFSVGKPVISTPIQELLLPKFKNIIKIGKDEKEWENHINEFVSSQWPRAKASKQEEMALKNSWRNKIERISLHIENL